MKRIAAMTDRHGQVITFYSYKGGTGRTMALANVAWILAANGHRVLVVDWDLESPGLHRFFKPFIADSLLANSRGVIDLIRDYEWAAVQSEDPGSLPHDEHARIHRFAFSVNWPHFPEGATLDFLPAGRHNDDYAASVTGLNWDEFYERLAGGLFFDELRADMIRNYDYILIDSRTGISDVAAICTVHLPDVLVDCFTLSDQGIIGAAQVANAMHHRNGSRQIKIFPVPMRVDPAEKDKAEQGRKVAQQRFPGLPALPMNEYQEYWAATQIPYQAFYAYEETLATFGDPPGTPGTLLAAYEKLTGRITEGVVTSLPPIDESLRLQVKNQFVRYPELVEERIRLRFWPEDEVWAEWIEYVLASSGVRVSGLTGDSNGAEVPQPRTMMIVSRGGPAASLPAPPHERGDRPMAVYVGATGGMSGEVHVTNSALVGGLSADDAANKILHLLGRPPLAAGTLAGGPRFPGIDPKILSPVPRNARFTGREADLRRLRDQLRSDKTAVVVPGTLPVALHGMGGIGKTEIAREYIHRYRRGYDVVWWVDADAGTDVNPKLSELATQLGVATQGDPVPDAAQAAVKALSRGEPYSRWLLVFDNAEDPKRLQDFLPTGSGHVLITARDPAWGDKAQTIPIDVFSRDESIDHLVRRVSRLERPDANRLAEALGDLPIVVAAAGAWLAETGSTVDAYLAYLARNPLGVWDLPLSELKRRSPAAYRLLEICSVMANEIGLELIYSDAMAELLKPYDSAVSDRLMRGSLVQQLFRLSLVLLDQQRRPGADFDRAEGGYAVVHRVLQLEVRGRMSDAEQHDLRRQVHRTLVAARPDSDIDASATWSNFRLLLPHLDASEAVTSTDESVRQLLVDRIRFNYLRGSYAAGLEKAEIYLKEWVSQLQRATDPATEATLRRQINQARFNLANMLREQGDVHRSLDLDQETLAAQQSLLGDKHPHTLMTAGSLAADLRARGRYGQALELDEQTYEAWADAFGDSHPRTLAALSNLAVSLRLMGRYRAALERDEQAFERRSAVLIEDHPDILRSAANLASDLRESGEYHRAISLLTWVVDRTRNLFGDRTRRTAVARVDLAVALRNADRADEAMVHLDEAYTILSESGDMAPPLLRCQLSRALTNLRLENLLPAEVELSSVLASYHDSLGPSHPYSLACGINMSALLWRAGDVHGGMAFARSARAELAAALAVDHPHTVAASMNAAICRFDLGERREGLEEMRHAAAVLGQVLGADHPQTLRCAANVEVMRKALAEPNSQADLTAAIDRLAARVGTTASTVEGLRRGRLLHRTVDPHPA
jgi:MinD-like ATPase involved in chromosome partitioning or flagellar assembly/tetratricopeptide (TPR) repeat protein